MPTSNGVSGTFGDAKLGGVQISELCKWSANPKANITAYASNKTGGFKWRVAGVKDMTGSMEGKYDPATPIMAQIDVGSVVALRLYLTATGFYALNAMIENLKLNVDLDSGEPVSWSADWGSVGPWTNPVAGVRADAPKGWERSRGGVVAPAAPALAPATAFAAATVPLTAAQLEQVRALVAEERRLMLAELVRAVQATKAA